MSLLSRIPFLFQILRLYPCFICVSSVALYSAQSAVADVPYEQKQDVVYGEVHGTGLLMDIFQPKEKPNGLAIVDVVSGAWFSDRNKIRDHTLAQFYDVFCTRGYVVFAARPGSKTRYTAAEMDQHIKMAIRYVKEHAGEYKIDPQKIGITGASAGGHLATLAALTPSAENRSAKRAIDRHDTSVSAVAVFFPPTDFIDWADGKMLDINVLAPLLFVGGSRTHTDEEIRDAAKAISPVHRITSVPFPMLLIHGDADQLVPLSHSQKLADAIKKAGGDVELIIKPGGGHPWVTIPEEVRVMADWFDKKLAK
jgi:acetyl esterase/lipase